ncbi:MAG: tetratricopeptide repeat protein [Gemmatimonadota bacterium]
MTSPTGKEYPPGIEPSQTEYTAQATLALAQGEFEQALEAAREGIAADSTNAEHFYLAGEAAAGLSDYELADSVWAEAERLYPAYELDIEPAREGAWAEAFNAGVEAYNAGDMAAAAEAWRSADMIYGYRPEAAQNLGVLLTQQGDYEEAVEVYRAGLNALNSLPSARVLEEVELEERDQARAEMEGSLAELLLFTEQFAEAEALFRQQLEANPDDIDLQANLANALSRQGREAEAAEIYTSLLETPGMPPSQLTNIGISLFQAGQHVRAADAFGQVVEVQPRNRDAWFNRANALYAAEEWGALTEIGDEIVAADPLNETVALILARAYRELEQNQDALTSLERLEALPVLIDELQLQPQSDRSVVLGTVIGNAASAGDSIRLEFTFYDDSGELGSETVTITAPAPEQTTEFEVVFPETAMAYSYDVL